MQRRRIATCLAALLALAACGGSDTAGSSTVESSTAPSATAADTTIQAETTIAADTTDSAATPTTGAGSIVNTWSGAPVDLTALLIGTPFVSTAGPSVGGLFACSAGNPNGGGAFRAGSWIDETAGTWDATAKVSVQGAVEWPMAKYSETVTGGSRSIASSGLPVDHVTGTFPVAADDPAFAYDRNPNTITENDVVYDLPTAPVAAAAPGCLPPAAVGVMRNGVVAFAPLDEKNRDAVAYETQDECDGHPQQAGIYHYHDVPSCIVAASEGPSTVVGFATDGFPIVVERDEAEQLPTNADLDECHGRTSPILLDGTVVEIYHYSATYEFPYFIGCFHGTPVS
jgi:hypothetical protein